jgi:transcriptional regulator NrdR family protein
VAKKQLRVYLAGPMTNCSERQKTVWRNRVNRELKADFKCLDPTDPRARRGALAVSADIEEADVVIANMWRESIGTTIGIVQAKRMGIPVILIDQHCIDSPILKSLAGDCIVHNEEAAINMLRHTIAPSLLGGVQVMKRGGTQVDFDIKKLQRSLKSACLTAGCDDPIFHILLSRRVHRAILTKSGTAPIKTETIRERILQELRNISREDDSQQVEHANALLDAWEFHEVLVKGQVREEQQKEKSYLTQIEELSGLISDLELERDNLRAQVNAQSHMSDVVPKVAALAQYNGHVEGIRGYLGGRRALCISSIGKTTFASAFERRGIQQSEFAEFFEEKLLEGKQSNLNSDLKTYIKCYPYVLYAFDGLRHLSKSLRETDNLIAGAGPNDAVRRFLMDVEKTAECPA